MRPLPNQPGPLGKLLALIFGAILLVLGFMFSLVILAVAAVVGLVAFGYFWWKTRELRRILREQQAAAASARPAGGEVFEGEAVVVEEYRAETQRLPAEERGTQDPPGR
jgi:ABC-type bacteriocin/lantibiotic exporter with double-glycine peptidase domain